MTKYCGAKAIIINNIDEPIYKLDIDNGFWNWEDYMFNKFNESQDIKDYCENYCISECESFCPLYKYKKINS